MDRAMMANVSGQADPLDSTNPAPSCGQPFCLAKQIRRVYPEPQVWPPEAAFISDLDEFPVVIGASKEYLNPRQLLDYRAEREACPDWLLIFGKKSDKAKGYVLGTIKTSACRMDWFYRFVWEDGGGCTANIIHEHADA